jgi:ankyrin repeat protein
MTDEQIETLIDEVTKPDWVGSDHKRIILLADAICGFEGDSACVEWGGIDGNAKIRVSEGRLSPEIYKQLQKARPLFLPSFDLLCSLNDPCPKGESFDLDGVRRALDAGADVNCIWTEKEVYQYDGYEGLKPIHIASMEKFTEVVKLLIKHGADVNAKGPYGQTALYYAIYSYRDEIAELLIANGADVNAKSDDGDTPLLAAARQPDPAMDEFTLDEYKLRTYRAIYDITELLIVKGADVNVRDKQGNTPLYACEAQARFRTDSHNKNISELLRKNGAKHYSIYHAIICGSIEDVRLFLDSGVNIETKNYDGAICERYYSGDTPLHCAVGELQKEILELLIAKGADVNARDEDDLSPLHYASQKEISELLIAEGADVNAMDRHGKTPLYTAAGGHKEVVELLIANGVDVNVKDEDGETPLDYSEKVYSWDSPERKTAKKQTADLLRKHGGKTAEELKAEGK